MAYKLGSIMLYVHDLARAKEFYTTVLEAKVTMELPDDGFVSLSLAGGSDLSLFDISQGRLPVGVSGVPGGCELDIEVDDLDAVYRDWQARGVSALGEIISHGSVRLFYAKDPDGHSLSIFHIDRPQQ